MAGRFISDHGNPPNVRSSSTGCFARGRRDSDCRYVKSKGKRVRFAAVDRDPLSNHRSDDSSTGYKMSGDPRTGIPKTSEYAFFKKVKEASVQHNQHSLSKECDQKLKATRHYYPNILHKEKEKMRNSNTNDCIGEAVSKSNMLNCHAKDRKLSISEKVSPNNQGLFVSPVEGRCKSPGEACSVGPKYWSLKHPMNVTTLDQNLELSPQTAPKFSGSQYFENEVFSAKRQKLRQWAEMALAGTENFSSKGYDMVTVLLSRLSPGNNEKFKNKGSKFPGNTGCSPAFQESDPSETRHHQSYRQDLTELEYGTCQSSELCRCPVGTREIIPVDWPAFSSDDCFTEYNAKTISRNEMVDNNHASKTETATSWLKQIDSPAPLLFEKSGFTDWYHLKEPDSFYCPNESDRYHLKEPDSFYCPNQSDWYHLKEPDSLYRPNESPRRKPQPLLLEWDFNEENEPEIAITLQDADLQKSINARHDAMGLCSSSLFFDHPPHFRSLPDFHSTSLQEELYSANSHTRDFGRNLEYEEYAVAEPDHLSSLYDEDYVDSISTYKYSNASYYLDYPQGSPIQVSHEKDNLESDSFHLPMALNDSELDSILAIDFPLPNHSTQHQYRRTYNIQSEKAWNFSSSNSNTVSFQEEAFINSHEQPSSKFLTSFDCPLLLTNSSWDKPEEETYNGYSDF